LVDVRLTPTPGNAMERYAFSIGLTLGLILNAITLGVCWAL
jgi:hypothetical protein